MDDVRTHLVRSGAPSLISPAALSGRDLWPGAAGPSALRNPPSERDGGWSDAPLEGEADDDSQVAYASKMGATKEIAEVIGVQLADAGLDVQVRDACDVTTVHGYDAVVVASAIHAPRWRPDAVQVVELIVDKNDDIGQRPPWLFHSGPCGESAGTHDVVAPKKVRRAAHRLGIAPPVTFGGRLDPGTAKGFIARKMAKGPMAGDFLDFDRIRAWADDIGGQLTSLHADLGVADTLPQAHQDTVHTTGIFPEADPGEPRCSARSR